MDIFLGLVLIAVIVGPSALAWLVYGILFDDR